MRVPQPGEVFGRYRLDRVIGQGGMGVVFAATDTRLNRTVALKVITGPLAGNEDFLRRFHTEATVLSQLDSPYVIQITDHDEVDGVPYIVTQFVSGTDLSSYLQSHGPLPVRTALVLCAQVARGLGDAHRSGVVHRDIKPGNVLVRAIDTSDMHAYVCDFGIARSEADDGHTAPGIVAGTWTYIAPERTNGAPASPATDLYALGCLLWTCLTGSPPYNGTEVEVVLAHAQAPVPQVPGNDPFTTRLNAVLARLLAKDPAERYGDAAVVRADVERLVADAPATALTRPGRHSDATALRPAAPTAPRPPDAAPTPAPKRRWRVAAAAAVVLLLAGGGAIAAVALAGADDPDDPDDPKDERRAAAVSGDVDGDGYGDLLLYQRRSETFTTLGTWVVPSFGTGFGSPARGDAFEGSPSTGDVDGDGRVDLLWADADDGLVTLQVDPAAGEPWEQMLDAGPTADISDYAVTAGDVTGDGIQDLILPGRTDQDVVHVAVGTGDQFEQPRQWWASDAENGFFFPAGDFDGDGTSELLYWADTDAAQSGEMRLLVADGDRFTVGPTRPVKGASLNPNLAPWLVGDPDGDGRAELVILTGKGLRVVVLEEDDGALTDPATWWFTPLTPEEIREEIYGSTVETHQLADVDGDGDDDLVEVHQPVDERIAITVRISDGSSFADPVERGSLACSGVECEDILAAIH